MTRSSVELTKSSVEEPSHIAVSQPGWRRALLWVADHELWIVGAVALPLMFPGRFPRPLLFTSLAVLTLLWPLRWIVWKRITRRTAFDIPILALLLMLPASLYATADFSTSLPKLTGMLLGVAIFYAVVNTIATREDIAGLAGILLLVAMGVVSASLIGTSWRGEKLPFIPNVDQILPTYTHELTRTGGFNRNQIGGTLILFIPLNMTLLTTTLLASGGVNVDHKGSILTARLQNHRYIVIALLTIVLLLTVSTLLLTQSRSALIGLGTALLFLLSLRNRWTAIGFIALAVFALAGVWWIGPTEIGQLLLDVTNGGSPVGTLDLAGRQEVWSRAVYILQDFPYTGVGLGMFNRVVHVLYPFFLIDPGVDVVHAHNVFLQVGVDLGLPGLVAYIGLITAFCVIAWRAGRHAPTPYMRAVGFGLLGGMVAYHVYGLTDAMTLGAKPGAALWAMFGLATVLDRYVAQSTDRL